MDDPMDPGRVLLDPNEDGGEARTLFAVSANAEGTLLSYSFQMAGRSAEWRIRDVQTGQDRADLLKGIAAPIFGPDDESILYTRNRDEIWRHRLGDLQESDENIFSWPHEASSLPATLKIHIVDGPSLLITSRVGAANFDVKVLIAESIPERGGSWDWRCLAEFGAFHEVLGKRGREVLLRTDREAPMGRVVAVDIDKPNPKDWRELVPQSDIVNLLMGQAQLVGNYLVTVGARRSKEVLCVTSVEEGSTTEVPTPDGTCSWLSSRQHATGDLRTIRADPTIYYDLHFFADPPQVARLDVAKSESIIVFPTSSNETSPIVTEEVFVTSADGAKVPMALVMGRSPKKTADVPVLLIGYGRGLSMNPILTSAFMGWPSLRIWIEMGGIVAAAGVRGGEEFGRAWHNAGRLEQKQNCFDDIEACARWVVSQGWTRPSQLVIAGASNGGLLVGAAITQHPELYRAAVADVGLFDMLRFHEFGGSRVFITEFGCSDHTEQFHWLLGYSPLHRLQDGQAYPATLITSGEKDLGLVANSYKFTAALQRAQGASAPILLRTEPDAAHGQNLTKKMTVGHQTDVLAFLRNEIEANSHPD